MDEYLIGKMIFYNNKNGDIYLIIPDTVTNVYQEEKTINYYKEIYPQLHDANIEDISILQLEFEEMKESFDNTKNVSVNLDTKQLQFIYYTVEELAELEAAGIE